MLKKKKETIVLVKSKAQNPSFTYQALCLFCCCSYCLVQVDFDTFEILLVCKDNFAVGAKSGCRNDSCSSLNKS